MKDLKLTRFAGVLCVVVLFMLCFQIRACHDKQVAAHASGTMTPSPNNPEAPKESPYDNKTGEKTENLLGVQHEVERTTLSPATSDQYHPTYVGLDYAGVSDRGPIGLHGKTNAVWHWYVLSQTTPMEWINVQGNLTYTVKTSGPVIWEIKTVDCKHYKVRVVPGPNGGGQEWRNGAFDPTIRKFDPKEIKGTSEIMVYKDPDSKSGVACEFGFIYQ